MLPVTRRASVWQGRSQEDTEPIGLRVAAHETTGGATIALPLVLRRVRICQGRYPEMDSALSRVRSSV